MVSKGIRVYAWVGVNGCSINFSVPANVATYTALHQWSTTLLEVDTKNLPGFMSYVGRFQWFVRDGTGVQLATGYNDINALTGSLEGGTMTTVAGSRSILVKNLIINYGFYDAGRGEAGLPNTDLCWVTVTPNQSNWMGLAAAPSSPQAQKPFTTFCLPAPHDVGMNSMHHTDAILNNATSLADVAPAMLRFAGSVGPVLSQTLTPSMVGLTSDIIAGLAITQKDTLKTLLNLGARYFEFRPAHMSKAFSQASPLPDKLYFQHACIPGMAYEDFLRGLVEFLVLNPTEIVVVQIRFDGVLQSCAFATTEELQSYMKTALAFANGPLVAGNAHDMKTLSTDQLRAQAKRLIVFENGHQYSSYAGGNDTLAPGPIIDEFKNMAGAKEIGADIAVFQCQATATNLKPVVLHSVFTSNTSNSCLLCTKPLCDLETLPWLQKNLPGSMRPDVLMVIMNDFFDGATADVAIGLSKKMLNEGLS